jgi:hypothetical protein
MFIIAFTTAAAPKATMWSKYSIHFISSKTYENPLIDVKGFKITFISPSGKRKTVNGFWNGGTSWEARFLPDEPGNWSWNSKCSDKENKGLEEQTGTFSCRKSKKIGSLFPMGDLARPVGEYHLSFKDDTPFFWTACTAWNGALKSTTEDWEYYLTQRKANNYNVIQFVTTQWRGCDKNGEGLTAFEGTEHITINPEFFNRLDDRIDRINAHGLFAAPVLLWALPTGKGRELNPGYYLPVDDAVVLAKYMVARYQGNMVIWILGGDGRFSGEMEVRWKEIGHRVFSGIDHAPVTLHPQGSSWIGEQYASEEWYDLVGYQSSHSNSAIVVNWINKGPMSQMWSKIKPIPYINMEPNYEEINNQITARDVRNASYWSIFSTPIAGITYGANGIWPWINDGENILNHGKQAKLTGWKKSIDFPGSIQVGYLSRFIRQFDWWKFYPANEILAEQPGEKVYNQWISVVRKDDFSQILAYIPCRGTIKLKNAQGLVYQISWFDPVAGKILKGLWEIDGPIISIDQNIDHDMVLILKTRK